MLNGNPRSVRLALRFMKLRLVLLRKMRLKVRFRFNRFTSTLSGSAILLRNRLLAFCSSKRVSLKLFPMLPTLAKSQVSFVRMTV